MSDPKADEAALDRWKEKFFDLQDTHELEAKSALEFRSILQRLLLRVVLSAEGQSHDFDLRLAELRKIVKSQDISSEDLSEQLNDFDQALAVLDENKNATLRKFMTVFDELVQQLLELKPARSQRSALKKLNSSFSTKSITSERVVPLLDDYKVLQGEVLAAFSGEEEKPAGLFGRIFSADKQRETEKIAPDEAVAELEIDTQDEAEEDEVVPGFSAISVHVRATMNSLLDQLTFPESSTRALKRLRARIDKTLNWYELGPTLDELSGVVLSAVGKGQRDFGQFLSDIDERLNKIQSFVLETVQAEQGLRKEEQLLDQQMRKQIETMASSLEESSDVETLKRSIRSQVENISTVLDKFSENGRKIEESKAKELEAMRLRFKALEEETRFFRQRLKEERSKALKDALTQLPNREAYDERIEMELERWKRYRKPATLVVTDVDHFKSINDNYGHLSGDKVLQILAKEVQSRMRKTDFVARYGGEEFVMILPETELDVAKDVIEKIRETISRLPFHFRDEKLQVTLSFGLVAFAEGLDTNLLFDRADKALYQAKKNGRNRLEVWTPA